MSTPHPTRTEDVFSTLRHEVLTGQYRPGERLPSERELALRFETGRKAPGADPGSQPSMRRTLMCSAPF